MNGIVRASIHIFTIINKPVFIKQTRSDGAVKISCVINPFKLTQRGGHSR